MGFWDQICVLSVYISYTQNSLSKRVILVIELQNLCLYTRLNFRDFVLMKKNPKQKWGLVGIVGPLSIVIHSFVYPPYTIRLSTTDVRLHEYD